MIPISLGPASGKHPDIAADPTGWVGVYQDEATSAIVLFQRHPNGDPRAIDVPISIGGPQSAFPRVYVDDLQQTWLAWRENPTNQGYLLNVSRGERYRLGILHGNNPVCFGNGLCIWQGSAQYDCWTTTLSDPILSRPTGMRGSPTGLSHVFGGLPVLLDDLRLDEPGMVNPQSASGCVVGENADAGPSRNIARLDADGREVALWTGQDSFTPHIAWGHGYWAVVTAGAPAGVRMALLTTADFSAPQPSPEPLPDTPFVVDPHGVVEDAAAWIFAMNQGPDVHLSPDGLIRFFCKSDERSGDGPDQHIGEHWDRDALAIGHLDDASTGRRILDGKEVIAEDIVRMFPETHAQVWASLPINHNWFASGRRLWMPRRCTSGTSIRYVTDIAWTVPPRETPHTNVWKHIPIEIRVDVGHGVIHGKEVRLRSAYIPDGHPEVSYYGPPQGYNAWIAGPFATFEPEWLSS